MASLPKAIDCSNVLKISEPFFTEIGKKQTTNKLKIHVEATRFQIAKSILSKKKIIIILPYLTSSQKYRTIVIKTD